MKKTLLYILILGAVGFGVWFLIFKDKSAFSGKDAAFSIRDTAAIGKIFLATKDNETITLERTPKGWMVNNKYKARPASLEQLMMALQYQEPQTPVSQGMHNNVVRSLMNGSIKVEIYNRNGERMRTFYVGGETNSGSGTFMLMEGGSKPYVVQIPGFSGYLTPRYMPDLIMWRDRGIFNIGAGDVEQITVTYPDEPLNSFTIARQDKTFKAIIDPALMEGKTMNTKRVDDYVKFYEKINAEQVLNGIAGVRENLSRMPRICTIVVKGKDGYQQDADLYPTPITRRSKNMTAETADTTEAYDSDRMYAVINQKRDTFLVQVQMFKKVLRLGYEFYTEDQQQPSLNTNIEGLK